MVYVELRALKGDQWSDDLKVNDGHLQADQSLRHMPTPEMNALSYSQLKNLMALIERHWACFEPYLPPKGLWEAKLTEVSQIRNRIAHFRIGHTDDLQRVRQLLRDLDAGFWTFCTSYNAGRPILPQEDDPVTAHFLDLDPLPWTELKPKRWARVGTVDRSTVIGMTVDVITRPWAMPVHSVGGQAGHLYDLHLLSHERIFDYERLLEATRPLHRHIAHICLGHLEDTIRLTVPTILGSQKIIELLEQFLESARYCVSRSRNPIASSPDKLADEWPEHVIGPRNPLTFLGPGMKCSFFSV